MTLRDWVTFLVSLGGGVAWFYTWWRTRRRDKLDAEMQEKIEKEAAAKKSEMRGVSGYKFRLMYRTLAKQHGWPLNGEDTD